MATSFSPTPAEAALVNQIFNKHDPQKFGVITGDVAVNVFRGANLSAITLGQIWGIADADSQGFLTRKGVSLAVRLIGWAQKGDTITITGDLVNKPGPLAVIDGFSSPSEPRRAVSPSPGSSRLPPSLTPQDKAKFTEMFNSCGPVNGLVTGQNARDVFVKSKLPLEKLSQIWNLSDTQNRGSLDVTDFIIAMYLIRSSMSGQLPFIPTTLPPGLYEMASGKGLPGSAATSHATGNSGSFSPGVSSTFPQNGGSGVVQPHLTGRPLQPQYSGQALQQQFTGQLSQHQTGSKSGFSRNTPASPSFAAASAVQSQTWDVTPTEKARADKLFDTLDTHKRGYIEGDVAVPFMLLSKLPEDVLALIWDLADLNNDGRLTRDGFAVALHLIQGKITGKDIPTTLPASLIPPSMRPAPVPATSPFQPPPSESLKDLIWDDPPSSSATSQPHSTILQPQRTAPLSPQSAFSSPQVTASQTLGQGAFGPPASNKNLLDDDEDAGVGAPTTVIHDHSAEIGNLQNQLQSTTRSLESTKTERTNVEGAVESQAIQLSTLQTQLSSAKAAYETETRVLAALRERFSNQSSEIQKTREELIRAESDLSAIRVEKTEVEQNLLRDKEEIRELQRKMTETGSMIEVAKAEIEKAKKDAKQQKGLLAIAKKQLATREAERAKAAQELQESVAEAEETKKELEDVEAGLARESPPAATTANGFPPAPSPALSGDSTTLAAAKPLPGTPGSPSSINGLASPKSNNPFERFAAESASRSQSPFLPLANTSIPTATDVTSVPNEGTTTDNPFTFDQAFGSEEPGPAPDVEGTSTGTDGTAQASVPKLVGELSIVTNEELSSPSSDRDLFSTPPMTGLDALGAGAQAVTSEPSVLKLPPPGTPSAAPSTDRPPEAHTDIHTQLKEVDVDESDSSDEDSEDETPLAALANRPPPPSKVDAKPDAATEELVSNGHTWPETKAEAPFPPVSAVAAPVEAQSTNPFPPAPTQSNSIFPAATSPFAASPEAPKVTNVSDFDKVFGDVAGAVPTATENELSFEAAFDEQFDFGKEGASTFPPAAGSSPSGSTTFPPAPVGLSGLVIPPASPPRASGFESAFIPQQSTANSVRPVSTVDGLPPLPQIPESKPFSFDDAFASLSPTLGPAVPTDTAPSQPPPTTDAQNLSLLDDAPGSNITGRDSGFGTTSSRTSSIPQVTQSPVSAVPSNSPTRGPTSPRDSVIFPISLSQPRQSSPPLRIASPKARPSTSSSKESSDRHKEQGRPSKISMIRLPFTKKKKTQESLPPPQHPSSIVSNDGDDDVEPVKQLCSMGFSRTQAVAALEASSYDVQRALNSLLSG